MLNNVEFEPCAASFLQAVKTACRSTARELFDNDNSALAPGCAGGSRRREPLSEAWQPHAKRGGPAHPSHDVNEGG